MRQTIFIFLVLSSIWGCSTTEKNATTPEGLYKLGQEYDADERYDIAIQKYQELKNKYPYSNYATMAELAVADAYYKQESFPEAQTAYQSFKDLHPKHAKIDYVIFQLGMSYFKQLPSSIDRDLTLTNDAIKNFHELLDRFPTSEWVDQAKKHLAEAEHMQAEKEIYIGDFYFKRDNWLSALPRYENFIEHFPSSEYVPKAHARAAISAFNLGDGAKADKHLNVLETQYPSSQEMQDARKVIRR